MAIHNRECYYCKTPYYVCKSCVDIRSWKNSCCSVKCYQAFMENKQRIKQEAIRSDTETKEVAKVIVNKEKEAIQVTGILTNRKKVQIIDFDLKSGKFNCGDGLVREAGAFKEFVLNYNELLELSNTTYNKTVSE